MGDIFGTQSTSYSVQKGSYKGSKEFDSGFFYDGNDSQSEGNSEFVGKFISHSKVSILLLLAIVGFTMLFGKTLYLQVIRNAHYMSLAEGNRVREVPTQSNRGLIYDSQGVSLVGNNPTFDASIIPADLPILQDERKKTIEQISGLLNMSVEDIELVLSEYPVRLEQAISLKENIAYNDALELYIKSSSLPAIVMQTRNNREYLIPDAGYGHLLGYIGKINREEYEEKRIEDYLLNDYIGKNGLERYYETDLRGVYGFQEIEVDARGKAKKVLSVTKPEPGKHLQLSIDTELQKKVMEILEARLSRAGFTRASVVVMDPNNGRVKSMVSYPDYDTNLFVNGISHEDYSALIENENNPLFNRTIKGTYPSGSTIKILMGAALDEGVITTETGFQSTGGIWYADRWFFPDWKAGGHGYTNIYKAISDSVNTFFYYIGGGFKDFDGLGLERIKKYYQRSGLGAVTGIDLYGEANGLVPSRKWKHETKNEEWYIGDTYHLSIGQGDILVTPLQVANYTTIFANGGKLYEPSLVQYTINPETEEKTETEVMTINEQVFTPESVAVIKRAMKETVLSGSAIRLNSLPVSAGGKTGTAQWHPTKEAHAWFTSFAPYENPELVVTVLVEEGVEGSGISVAIAYDILDWYFNK